MLSAPGAEAGRRDARHLAQTTDEGRAQDHREAAEMARKRSGGRVLSSDPAETRDGRPAYRVKVLTPEGHVRVLVIEGRRKGDE